MSDLYALTPRTADALAELLGRGGEIGGRGQSGAAARGVTWVIVTGGESGGWHAGNVVSDDRGTFTALPGGTGASACNVKAEAGVPLRVGQIYACVRTGGTGPSFRVIHAAASGLRILGSTYTIPDGNATWRTVNDGSNVELSLGAAGTYLIWGQAQGVLSEAGSIFIRAYNSTDSSGLPGSAVLCLSNNVAATAFGSGHFATVCTVAGAKTIQLQAKYVVGPTPPSLKEVQTGPGSGDSGTALGFVRL